MMQRLPKPARRVLIRIAYLLPLLGGLIHLIASAVPRIYFIYEGQARTTQSSFSLVSHIFRDCSALLNGSTEGSNYAVLFSYFMIFFAVLFWIGLICYWVMALSAAIGSCKAFSAAPTSHTANQTKRWVRFFCPNRVTYVLSHIPLLLSAAFPQILLYFYHTQMGYTDMSLHFFGPSDLILTLILVAISLILYLATLPIQAQERMDLYRLYKAKERKRDCCI